MSARQSWAFFVDSVPFTRAVVAGETSLGGSESACLGLARALAQRGHAVHVFATKLAADAGGPDRAGVVWHSVDDFTGMNQFIEWDVVCALRAFALFRFPIQARLRLLWNQDLLVPGDMQAGVMAVAWALDQIAYVSDYHRRQWEDLQPELAPIGWVSRNGFDPACVPASSTKDPNRIIHISRPERGLEPILAMWPELKRRVPQATLQLCRYSSMYDQGPGSWSDTCAAFDQSVEAVNAAVGGITYLGELAKPALYKAIADAAVMWYPGVDNFAETSCIAAIEAQACGTPFVGSWKGALPETVPAGVLVKGDALTDAYQNDSIGAVEQLLADCRSQSFRYRQLVKSGRAHVESYTYAAIAAEWEARVDGWFAERYEGNKLGVLRQLLHEDDHVAASGVAKEIAGGHGYFGKTQVPLNERMTRAARGDHDWPVYNEAINAELFCDRVIAGKDQGAEDYAERAIADPLLEAQYSPRFQSVIPNFTNATRVLDCACGNGSFAIALALALPHIHVHGLDYAQGNIDRAIEAAGRAGVADRCTFARCTVYDFDRQAMHEDFQTFAREALTQGLPFDGLFVGEFVEHVGDCTLLVDALEAVLVETATVVYTCPHGACAEMVPRNVPLRRGHVHRFHHDDLAAVWGGKVGFASVYLPSGITQRGNPLGNWMIRYEVARGNRAGQRDLETRAVRTRPMPRLSVGLIVKDGELDLARCLNSVWSIADEIIVGDTGSTDRTATIAAEFGARVIGLPPVENFEDGFAGARNVVLDACSGDWFLWIDADEQLINAPLLRGYLDGPIYNGFVIRQQHLYLDAAPAFDIPTRVFRRLPAIEFYGCIHEQPQMGDANTDIAPTLSLDDVVLAHTGYLTGDIREGKRAHRNLPLLKRDQAVFPERLLGKVLLLRETVVEADMDRQIHGGLTTRASQGYGHALRLYLEHFDDPGHKFHKLARPWYEAALQHLGLGWEMELALAGKPGGLGAAQAKPERIWVRDYAEFERILAHRLDAIAAKMTGGVTFKTNPDLGVDVKTLNRALAGEHVPGEVTGVPV